MADRLIEIPGVGQVAFPDSMSDHEVEQAAAKLYADHEKTSAPTPTVSETSSSPSQVAPAIGLGLAAASKVAKPIAAGLEELATNPTVPYIGSKIGRAIGGIAPVVGGAAEGGPVGALVGMAAAAKGAWAGGKTGWFTAKLAQKLAAPLSTAADAVAPFAGALATPLSVLSAESEVLSRLNDPENIQQLKDRLNGAPPTDRQPDYIDTLNRWFGTVKAAQQVAPNTVLSAAEIKKLNQLVEGGMPVPIATQTVLQLRGSR